MWKVKRMAVPTVTDKNKNITISHKRLAILVKAYILRQHINVAFNYFTPNDAYTASQGTAVSYRMTQRPIMVILLSWWCFRLASAFYFLVRAGIQKFSSGN